MSITICKADSFLGRIKQVILETDISSCTNFEFMVLFTELRNCIVHNEGIIYSNTENLKRLNSLKDLKKSGFIDLKETEGIKNIRNEVVIKDKLFLVESVSKIETFLHEMETLLQPHY